MFKFKVGDKVFLDARSDWEAGTVESISNHPATGPMYRVLFANSFPNWYSGFALKPASYTKPTVTQPDPLMYKFKVTAGGDIDFQRICNEAPKDVNIIRVERPGSYSLGWILVRGSAVAKNFPIVCNVVTPSCVYTSKNLQGWYSFPCYIIEETKPILTGVREKIKAYAAEKAAEKAKISVTVRYEK